MDFQHLEHLRATHPALRLLTADNAPLIISFLFRVFIEPSRRSVPGHEAETLLSDYQQDLERWIRELNPDPMLAPYPLPPLASRRKGLQNRQSGGGTVARS